MKAKICGITTPADAAMVAQAGADWVGLNFHPPSARSISEATAKAIVAVLPPHVEPVGLFVNRPPGEVADIATRVGLRMIQLHGDEPVEDLAILRDLQVVRAFRLGSEADVDGMHAYVRSTADAGRPLFAVLVDAYVPAQYGGTGHAIEPTLLARLAPLRSELPRLILAGGLTPENITERAAVVAPWMIDVAGGVESSPGKKDPDRVRRFLLAIRHL